MGGQWLEPHSLSSINNKSKADCSTGYDEHDIKNNEKGYKTISGNGLELQCAKLKNFCPKTVVGTAKIPNSGT